MNHGLFLNFNFPKRNRGGPPHAAQGDPPFGRGGPPLTPSETEQENFFLEKVLKSFGIFSKLDI